MDHIKQNGQDGRDFKDQARCQEKATIPIVIDKNDQQQPRNVTNGRSRIHDSDVIALDFEEQSRERKKSTTPDALYENDGIKQQQDLEHITEAIKPALQHHKLLINHEPCNQQYHGVNVVDFQDKSRERKGTTTSSAVHEIDSEKQQETSRPISEILKTTSELFETRTSVSPPPVNQGIIEKQHRFVSFDFKDQPSSRAIQPGATSNVSASRSSAIDQQNTASASQSDSSVATSVVETCNCEVGNNYKRNESDQESMVSAEVVDESMYKPFARARPVREINRRHILLALAAIFLIALIVSVSSVIVTQQNRADPLSISVGPPSTSPPSTSHLVSTLTLTSEPTLDDFTFLTSEPTMDDFTFLTSEPTMDDFTFPTSEPTTDDFTFLTEKPTSDERQWVQLGEEISNYYSDDGTGNAIAISRNGLAIAIGARYINLLTTLRYENGAWTRTGATWLSDDMEDKGEYGYSVALDDSGTVIAVGAPHIVNYGWRDAVNATPVPGRVRVFRLNSTMAPLDDIKVTSDFESDSYNQIGADIVGIGPEDHFGSTVDISDEGDVIVAGSQNACYVQAYQHLSQNWEEYGQAIGCAETFRYTFNTKVRLSGDASTLAIGEVLGDWESNDDEYPENSKGFVRVFNYDGSVWQQLGQTLEGLAEGDAFGSSIAISDDGLVLAACAPYSSAGREQLQTHQGTLQPKIGSCRVFRYNAKSMIWQPRGKNINGEDFFDYFGSSVSLDSSGSVIAIGAIGSNENGKDSGHASVFQYEPNEDAWFLTGQKIAGPFPDSELGAAVALSARGDIVTVGANTLEDDSRPTKKGYLQVFETQAILPGGDLPLEVIIHTDTSPGGISWTLERIDVAREDTVGIANVPLGTYQHQNDAESNIVMISEGGVYRFQFYHKYEPNWWTDTHEENTSADLKLGEKEIVQGLGNTSDYSQFTFVARETNGTMTDFRKRGPLFVTLVINFDSKPEDVHWVLATSKFVQNNETGEILNQRNVLAFGPEKEYGLIYANSKYKVTIDLSNIQETSKLYFYFTDDGRDGLCCNHGHGFFRLYNGTSADDEREVLFSSTAEGRKREFVSFNLFDSVTGAL